jgi:hypothetical protein
MISGRNRMISALVMTRSMKSWWRKYCLPRKAPKHREMLEWVGGAFDPEAFNLAV